MCLCPELGSVPWCGLVGSGDGLDHVQIRQVTPQLDNSCHLKASATEQVLEISSALFVAVQSEKTLWPESLHNYTPFTRDPVQQPPFVCEWAGLR